MILQQAKRNINQMHSITVLIKNSVYPFGQNLDMETVKIEEAQRFTSADSLKQKKSQMLRKADLLNSPYIIQLLAVHHENMYLKYEWQYVPHNLQSYIFSKFTISSKEIWKMTKTLLLKKISFELTMLMSFLSKMKIETDFSVQNIGITNDQKIKFYLNPKTRMGIRSQLSLIAVYGQAKEKVLKEFRTKLQKIEQEQQQEGSHIQPQINFKANRDFYEQKMHNESFVQSISSSVITNRTSKQMPQEKKQQKYQKPKRKMSFNNFEPGYNSDIKSNNQRANSNHKHKYSFQYNAQKQQPNKPFKNNFKDYKNYQKEQNEGQSLNHSKSIKIQLQQKQCLDSRKKRKDSYKVKITTYHEYQLDDCPPQFFKTNNEQDIFEHFAKRAQKEEQQRQFQQDKNDQQEGNFNSHNAKQGNQYATEAPSPIFSNKSNISERIQMARQRSQQALHKIKFMKK